MKNFKTSLIIAILLLGFQSYTYAQKECAHIDTQALISSMPEMKTAKIEFDQFQQSAGAKIQASITEYRNKLTQYSNEALTKTDAENESRKEELAELEARIQQGQAEAEVSAEQKYIDLTKPIQEKALAAIQKVAKAQGFSYVHDATPGSGLLVMEGPDLMNAVKKELGIR